MAIIEDLQRECQKLFNDRMSLMSLWQEIADHFYPERADFTIQRNVGTDFAAGLMTTYPLLVRRDLGNSFSSMLRPTGKEWFEMTVNDDESKLDVDSKRWLEWAGRVMRRAMYDRKTNFVRATKEGDHDFATFGNAALTCELGPDASTLLYRSWHLRDVVWSEGADSSVDCVYHKWSNATMRTLKRMFPKTFPMQLEERLSKNPLEEITVYRAVMSQDVFNDAAINGPWVSVYYLCEPKVILEMKPLQDTVWSVPRWQTVSGSQYGHSPATVCGLPDARLIQAMTRVILEAGEKFTNPPLIGVQEAVRSDVQLFAGGITWVDAEYDERLGEVLRPLTQDKSGLNFGMDLRADIQMVMREAFFLNKIEMPAKPQEMTAYEVAQRVQEYIRQALPLFEPMEHDYNGSLCENTFGIMLRAGAFGPLDTIPRQLRNRDVKFKFSSPLQQALDSENMAKLQQSKAALSMIADIDPNAAHIFDAKRAFRDALRGARVPSTWVRSEREVDAIEEAVTQENEAEMQLSALAQSATAAKDLAAAKLSNSQAQAA